MRPESSRKSLAGWCDKYPDVELRRRLVLARSRPTLIEATRRDQLAVVGTRGRGGFTGPLLGSVSQAVPHHAECPVAIVPHRTKADLIGSGCPIRDLRTRPRHPRSGRNEA
jgi:hypothetical protein